MTQVYTDTVCIKCVNTQLKKLTYVLKQLRPNSSSLAGLMTQPTVSRHWRKPFGHWDQASIHQWPLYYVTMNKHQAHAIKHRRMVSVWQNLIWQTCRVLQKSSNYIILHNTTTRAIFPLTSKHHWSDKVYEMIVSEPMQLGDQIKPWK